MIVSSCSPVPGEGWVDLAARCGRGSRAEPQDRCRTSRCQFATVDRVHDVLLVALDVRAAACSDASGTLLRLFEDHGRKQPHQQAVSAELYVADLHEHLAGRSAAMLDLTDELRRVTNPNRKPRQRQIVRDAQPTKLGAQPGRSAGRRLKRRGRTATPAHHRGA
jgi:hypothetical protein